MKKGASAGALCTLTTYRSTTVTFAEPVNTSPGINNFLLSGIKGMACGANIHIHLTTCISRGSLKAVATATGNFDRLVFRMYACFHRIKTHRILSRGEILQKLAAMRKYQINEINEINDSRIYHEDHEGKTSLFVVKKDASAVLHRLRQKIQGTAEQVHGMGVRGKGNLDARNFSITPCLTCICRVQ